MSENELTKTIAIYKKTLEVTADNGETCFRELDKNTLSFLEELEQCRAIGTAEEFKALKEKSVAKKPDYEGDSYFNGQIILDTWICPNCGKGYEVDYEDYEHCPNCGQRIDHSGLTEDD